MEEELFETFENCAKGARIPMDEKAREELLRTFVACKKILLAEDPAVAVVFLTERYQDEVDYVLSYGAKPPDWYPKMKALGQAAAELHTAVKSADVFGWYDFYEALHAIPRGQEAAQLEDLLQEAGAMIIGSTFLYVGTHKRVGRFERLAEKMMGGRFLVPHNVT